MKHLSPTIFLSVDYIRAYCAEKELDYPDTAAVKEAFTSQVAYSRRRLGLTCLTTK